MATIVLFHHVQGLTVGVQGLRRRAAGARDTSFTTPDLFEGRTFTKLSGGMEYAKSVGFETLLERGVARRTIPSC
jgi:hypothetical protein